MNEETKENIKCGIEFGFGIAIGFTLTIIILVGIVTICGGYP
jgi:hypothetical protein